MGHSESKKKNEQTKHIMDSTTLTKKTILGLFAVLLLVLAIFALYNLQFHQTGFFIAGENETNSSNQTDNSTNQTSNNQTEANQTNTTTNQTNSNGSTSTSSSGGSAGITSTIKSDADPANVSINITLTPSYSDSSAYGFCRYTKGNLENKTEEGGNFLLYVVVNNFETSDKNVTLRAYLDDLSDGENLTELNTNTFNGTNQGIMPNWGGDCGGIGCGLGTTEYNLTVAGGGSNTVGWRVERPIYDGQYRIIVVPDGNWSKNKTEYFNITCVNETQFDEAVVAYYGTTQVNSTGACNEYFIVSGYLNYTARRNFMINYTLIYGSAVFSRNLTIDVSDGDKDGKGQVSLTKLYEDLPTMTSQSDGNYIINVSFAVWGGKDNANSSYILTDVNKTNNNATTNALTQKCNIDLSIKNINSVERNETCRCNISSINVEVCNLNPYDVWNETINVSLYNTTDKWGICKLEGMNMLWNKDNWQGSNPTNETCHNVSISNCIIPNVSDGNYNISVEIDPDNNITYSAINGTNASEEADPATYINITTNDTNRSNNILNYSYVKVNCTLDLVITSVNDTLAPASDSICMNNTRNITVNACMYNMHPNLVVPIDFYFNNTYNQTKNITFTQNCTTKTQNTTFSCSSVQFEVKMPADAVEGQNYNFTFSIDPQNNVSETNETNNNFTKQFKAQCNDLNISNLRLNPNTTYISDDNCSANRFYNWTVEVCNAEGPNLTNVRVDFYGKDRRYSLSGSNCYACSYTQDWIDGWWCPNNCEYMVRQTNYVNLSQGECKNITFVLSHSAKVEGNYTAVAMINPGKIISESNYSNNGFPTNQTQTRPYESYNNCTYIYTPFFWSHPIMEYPVQANYEVKYAYDLTPSFGVIRDYGYSTTTIGGNDYNAANRGICYGVDYNGSVRANRLNSERAVENVSMNFSRNGNFLEYYLTNISRCGDNNTGGCCDDAQYAEKYFQFRHNYSEGVNQTFNFIAEIDGGNNQNVSPFHQECNEINNIINYSYWVYPDVQNRGVGSTCCVDVEMIGAPIIECRGDRGIDGCYPEENITVYTNLRSWNKGTGQVTVAYYTVNSTNSSNITKTLSSAKTFNITDDTYSHEFNHTFMPNASVGDKFSIEVRVLDAYSTNMTNCVNISMTCNFNITDDVPTCVHPLDISDPNVANSGTPIYDIAYPDIAVSYNGMLGKEQHRYAYGCDSCCSTSCPTPYGNYQPIYKETSGSSCNILNDANGSSIVSLTKSGLTIKANTIYMNTEGSNIEDNNYYNINYIRYNPTSVSSTLGHSSSSTLFGLSGVSEWWGTCLFHPGGGCGAGWMYKYNYPTFKTLTPGFINIKGTSYPVHANGSNNVGYTWQVVYDNGTTTTICHRNITLGSGVGNITGVPLPILVYNTPNATNVTYTNITNDSYSEINVNGTKYNLSQYDPDLCLFDYSEGSVECKPHWRMVLDNVSDEGTNVNNVWDQKANAPCNEQNAVANSDNIFIGTYTDTWANPFIAEVVWPSKICGSGRKVVVSVCNNGLGFVGTENAYNVPVYMISKNVTLDKLKCCTACDNGTSCLNCSGSSSVVVQGGKQNVSVKAKTCRTLSYTLDATGYKEGEYMNVSAIVNPFHNSLFDASTNDNQMSNSILVDCSTDFELKSWNIFPKKCCDGSNVVGVASIYLDSGKEKVPAVLKARLYNASKVNYTNGTASDYQEGCNPNICGFNGSYTSSAIVGKEIRSVNFTAPLTPGNYTAEVWIDPPIHEGFPPSWKNGTTNETNETNNNKIQTIEVITCNQNVNVGSANYNISGADECSENKTFCLGNQSIVFTNVANRGNNRTVNATIYIYNNGSLEATKSLNVMLYGYGDATDRNNEIEFGNYTFNKTGKYNINLNISGATEDNYDDNYYNSTATDKTYTAINCSNGTDLRIINIEKIEPASGDCVHYFNVTVENRGAESAEDVVVLLTENETDGPRSSSFNISGYETKTISVPWIGGNKTNINISAEVSAVTGELDTSNNKYCGDDLVVNGVSCSGCHTCDESYQCSSGSCVGNLCSPCSCNTDNTCTNYTCECGSGCCVDHVCRADIVKGGYCVRNDCCGSGVCCGISCCGEGEKCESGVCKSGSNDPVPPIPLNNIFASVNSSECIGEQVCINLTNPNSTNIFINGEDKGTIQKTELWCFISGKEFYLITLNKTGYYGKTFNIDVSRLCHCGDGMCQTNYGETLQTCPKDCSISGAVCPNGKCESGENCTSCPADCANLTINYTYTSVGGKWCTWTPFSINLIHPENKNEVNLYYKTRNSTSTSGEENWKYLNENSDLSFDTLFFSADNRIAKFMINTTNSCYNPNNETFDINFVNCVCNNNGSCEDDEKESIGCCDCISSVCGDGNCLCETRETCPQDCKDCGDGICDASKGENCITCADDCKECISVRDNITDRGGIGGINADGLVLEFCGNGLCASSESCSTCEKDCGACDKPHCGDGVCRYDLGETCKTCMRDCGPCPVGPYCGDDICQSNEKCDECLVDCGKCPPISIFTGCLCKYHSCAWCWFVVLLLGTALSILTFLAMQLRNRTPSATETVFDKIKNSIYLALKKTPTTNIDKLGNYLSKSLDSGEKVKYSTKYSLNELVAGFVKKGWSNEDVIKAMSGLKYSNDYLQIGSSISVFLMFIGLAIAILTGKICCPLFTLFCDITSWIYIFLGVLSIAVVFLVSHIKYRVPDVDETTEAELSDYLAKNMKKSEILPGSKNISEILGLIWNKIIKKQPTEDILLLIKIKLNEILNKVTNIIFRKSSNDNIIPLLISKGWGLEQIAKAMSTITVLKNDYLPFVASLGALLFIGGLTLVFKMCDILWLPLIIVIPSALFLAYNWNNTRLEKEKIAKNITERQAKDISRDELMKRSIVVNFKDLKSEQIDYQGNKFWRVLTKDKSHEVLLDLKGKVLRVV